MRTPTSHRFRRAVSAALAVGVLTIGAAAHATEAETPAVEEGSGKVEIPLDPERPRDAVGLGILVVFGAMGLKALDNARRNLRGERSQASGRFRWR